MEDKWSKKKYAFESDIPWYKVNKDCHFLQACDVERPCVHCKYYIKKKRRIKMVGAVMTCPCCGEKLWDKETSYKRCIHCNGKLSGLTDKERIKILEDKVAKLLKHTLQR